jgi:hypothetical protein
VRPAHGSPHTRFNEVPEDTPTMTGLPIDRPPPARREALLSRLSAATEVTRALEAQLAPHPEADPAGLLVPAARALLGVLQRCGGGELVVSLGSDRQWSVRVRQDGSGPSVELVGDAVVTGATTPAVPRPAAAADLLPAPRPAPDQGVATRLAEVLRSGGAPW